MVRIGGSNGNGVSSGDGGCDNPCEKTGFHSTWKLPLPKAPRRQRIESKRLVLSVVATMWWGGTRIVGRTRAPSVLSLSLVPVPRSLMRSSPSFGFYNGRRSFLKRSALFSSVLSSSVEPSHTHETHEQQPYVKEVGFSTPASHLSQRQEQEEEKQRPTVNLQTIPFEELESLLVSWGEPRYRAKQIRHWVRERGVVSVEDMTDLPSQLRSKLAVHATAEGFLEVVERQVSRVDGTEKRAYRLPSVSGKGKDGAVIESVLMSYNDGRRTACISSQAGCAMGCVFCATGQMGLSGQLTADQIFEQAARFASDLKRKDPPERLSGVVFMGMGEPLANYRAVVEATRRIVDELGVGARRITVSTVGVVPSIRRLAMEETSRDIDNNNNDDNSSLPPPPFKLAVSLHRATDEGRSALLPANSRFGGLDALMESLRLYLDRTGRRITFEWAAIEGVNDRPEDARDLGLLLHKHFGRRRAADLTHVNVIPLNPTSEFFQKSSHRRRVDAFVDILSKEFGVTATPRVRRGIDIDAGCGQLTSKVMKRQQNQSKDQTERKQQSVDAPTMEDDDDDGAVLDLATAHAIDLDDPHTEFENDEDDAFLNKEEVAEAQRLIAKVSAALPTLPTKSESTIHSNPTETTIISSVSLNEDKKRRKKLLKHLKGIQKLVEKQEAGGTMNEEQLAKISKQEAFREELEHLEDRLSLSSSVAT